MPKQPIEFMFSPYRRQLLAALFLRPDEQFHVRELERMTGISAGSLHRELKAMAEAGLLRREQTGNQVFYRVDVSCSIHEELAAIFSKTMGIASLLREALSSLDGKIQWVFVFGSMARGEQHAGSDVDVMVVADGLPYAELMQALAVAEPALGRPVNPTLYTQAEFIERRASKNAFMTRVMEQPKLWIKGVKDDTETFAESGQDPPVKT